MEYKAAVVTMSDKGSQGLREDTAGDTVVRMLEENGWEIIYRTMIPDERDMIEKELADCADRLNPALIITTGGTGFSPRDVTPEATLAVVDRVVPGIPEAMRAASVRITPMGMLSRSAAGIRGNTLIVNLPGSKKSRLRVSGGRYRASRSRCRHASGPEGGLCDDSSPSRSREGGLHQRGEG